MIFRWKYFPQRDKVMRSDTALGGRSPADVHHGRAEEMLAQRERMLHKAWSKHPERFVHGMPKPQLLPQEVWINPPAAASIPQPVH